MKMVAVLCLPLFLSWQIRAEALFLAMEAGRRGASRPSPASSGHEDRRCEPGTAEPPPPAPQRCSMAGNRLPLVGGRGEARSDDGSGREALRRASGRHVGVRAAAVRGWPDRRKRRREDGIDVVGEAGRPRCRAVASVGEWRGATATSHGATASVPWERERGRWQGWWG
jgi:hypothetical protein